MWGGQKKVPGFLIPRKLKEISVKLYDPVVWLLRNLSRRLCGTQSRSGSFTEEKNLLE